VHILVDVEETALNRIFRPIRSFTSANVAGGMAGGIAAVLLVIFQFM
jgi:hypothetical protein